MKKKSVALFVMPRSSTAWRGSEALWITVAGWAAAAERKFGAAYVLTTDRIGVPKDVVNYPLGEKTTSASGKNPFTSLVPQPIKILIKDVLLWRSAKNSNHYNYEIPYKEGEISFVWEQHDFYPGKGYDLAKKYKVPFVIYVHAPQVWEAAKWGVHRPIWGQLLEKNEKRSLMRADVVACVSQQVADKLMDMGIPENKILISPMAIDGHLYSEVNSDEILKEYQLQDKFLIGWTGSFRSFHGLDLLVQVFKKVHEQVKDSHLMLVGDGLEMENIKKLVKELGLEGAVSFPGRMSFLKMTQTVHTFDIAILSARKKSEFHYSPMKLREYLKAGKATLAPNAGEIPIMFKDDEHLKLYEIGEIEETAQKIVELYHDNEKRELLGRQGREFILANGTWDVEVEKVIQKTGI